MTGCVAAWDEYEAADEEPRWPGVAAMLAGIADELEHGTDIDGYRAEARDDGTPDRV